MFKAALFILLQSMGRPKSGLCACVCSPSPDQKKILIFMVFKYSMPNMSQKQFQVILQPYEPRVLLFSNEETEPWRSEKTYPGPYFEYVMVSVFKYGNSLFHSQCVCYGLSLDVPQCLMQPWNWASRVCE